MQIPSLVQLLEAGLHFGHKRSRRHPKMEPFIFSVKNDINVIDLRLTQKYLEQALDVVKKVVAEGGSVLFVGTKKQASQLIEKYAKECGQPYVSHRWLGGTLTNFSVISKLVRNFLTLRKEKESGEFEKYTKKEQLELSRKIEDLDVLIGGIQAMSKLPSIVFIADMHHDTTAMKEARIRGIPIVALCDTNVNPELATYPIPGNDDAVKGLDMVISLISKAVLEGKDQRLVIEEKEKIERAEKAAKVAAASPEKKIEQTISI